MKNRRSHNERLVGRKKSLQDFRDMAVDLLKSAEDLRKQLEKYTDMNLQNLVQQAALTKATLDKMDYELGQVQDFLETGHNPKTKESDTLKNQISRLRTVVNVEFDSRFMK